MNVHFFSARERAEKKIFGFSFASVMELSGTTLRDGSHKLHVYRCEDRSKLYPRAYLSLPYSEKSKLEVQSAQFVRNSKEAMYINTLLCSTKLTQNGKWLPINYEIQSFITVTSPMAENSYSFVSKKLHSPNSSVLPVSLFKIPLFLQFSSRNSNENRLLIMSSFNFTLQYVESIDFHG